MNWQQRIVRMLLTILLVVGLGIGSIGCSRSPGTSSTGGLKPSSRLSEVSPPPAIQELHKAFDNRQPQVKILSPRPDEVLKDTTISVRLQVNDLPLFQNEEFGLGPHLHFILDNEPYQAIYDIQKPIELEDLEPGTHTIRVFASLPWYESFKNDGAYAQTTFHIFAKTAEDIPDPNQPLLTYSRPQGSYGAEPIMLDFYLTNAPLHLVASENPEDDILDWQIRCTINGESFTFDRWEPIYLKGFKPGKNWVQLELLDEQGNLVPGDFNDTIRIITYEPGGTDALSKLTRGEISVAEVFSIVDPTYVYAPPAPEPETEPSPVVEPSPIVEPSPVVMPSPVTESPSFDVAPEAAPEVAPNIKQPTVEQPTAEQPTVVEQPTVTDEPALTPNPESLQEVLEDLGDPNSSPFPSPAQTPEDVIQPSEFRSDLDASQSTPSTELPAELTSSPIPKTVELEAIDRLTPSVVEDIKDGKLSGQTTKPQPKGITPQAIEPVDESVRDELAEKVQQKLEEVQQKFDELSNELNIDSKEFTPVASPDLTPPIAPNAQPVPSTTDSSPRKLIDRAKGVLNRFRSRPDAPNAPTPEALDSLNEALNDFLEAPTP